MYAAALVFRSADDRRRSSATLDGVGTPAVPLCLIALRVRNRCKQAMGADVGRRAVVLGGMGSQAKRI